MTACGYKFYLLVFKSTSHEVSAANELDVELNKRR